MTTHLDEARGHFVIEHGQCQIVGGDMGASLWLSTSGRPSLSPDSARELAAALTWWADREHGSAEDIDRLAEVTDLLSLLDQEVPDA